MNHVSDFETKERERKTRRKVFHLTCLILALTFGGLMIWKMGGLILPIIVGALLAFLFRPIKERFRIPWLPHELQVLCSFAAIGLVLFFVFDNVRKHIPDEKQKLELKVRLKYKLNEKYQEMTPKSEGVKSGMIMPLVAKEVGPLMDRLNSMLELDREERELFRKYRVGHDGEAPIEDKFFDYFRANQRTSKYVLPEMAPSADATTAAAAGAIATASEPSAGKAESDPSVWILAPMIFIFLGFDDGQIRRYFIGLVPNRYFELSLTLMDRLDNAIGKYLRGTAMECCLVGLTLGLGLILLGIPVGVAVAIGVVSGLVNAIPFLGTVIGLIVSLGYALIAENIKPLIPGLNPNDLALYVLILIGITHVLDNAVFQPFVVGSAVNIHPVVVVVAILGGSLIMGLWGMLFAVPAVVVLKTAVETLFKELRAYRIT
jgi:predicted PurR-regulated permease PerM